MDKSGVGRNFRESHLAVAVYRRRHRSNRGDDRQHTKTKACFGDSVALERAYDATDQEAREQVKSVNRSNADHGSEQNYFEQDKTSIVRGDEIAWST